MELGPYNNTKDFLTSPILEMSAGGSSVFFGFTFQQSGIELPDLNAKNIMDAGLPYIAAIGGIALFTHGLHRAIKDIRSKD